MRWLPCALIGGMTFVAGCGDSGPTVRGKVNLNQQPLAGAEVVFFAEDKASQQIYGGKTNDAGVFELVAPGPAGIAPGPYRVAVTKYVGKDGAPLSAEEAVMRRMEGKAKNVAPPQYADPAKSPLRVEVAAGVNDVDLKLAGVKSK